MNFLADAPAEVSVLMELAKQVPSLVILAWIVWKFAGVLKDQSAACHEVQKASNACINENSRVLGQVSESFENQRQSIADAVRDAMNGKPHHNVV